MRALRYRVRRRCFATRKQEVEESRRIETPRGCHVRYDYAQHGHKIFTFDHGAESVFEVLTGAMAISH
jgi:hypothetical protein